MTNVESRNIFDSSQKQLSKILHLHDQYTSQYSVQLIPKHFDLLNILRLTHLYMPYMVNNISQYKLLIGNIDRVMAT